jgi:hypothetical protein
MSATRVLFASLVGTTIEFFDFYIYATAAVLVFPRLFFPSTDAASAMLQSLATFALAFFARPVGSAVFGHFGDRVGRKATLVAALHDHGDVDGAYRACCRPTLPPASSRRSCWRCAASARGLALAVSGVVRCCSPPRMRRRVKRAWYGMFPQLGAPLGFLVFERHLSTPESVAHRVAVYCVWLAPALSRKRAPRRRRSVRAVTADRDTGLPARDRKQRAGSPADASAVCTVYRRALIRGTFAATATFVLFYLMTVFALSWGTDVLGYARKDFLVLQMVGVVFFAVMIPISAVRLPHRRGSLGRCC